MQQITTVFALKRERDVRRSSLIKMIIWVYLSQSVIIYVVFLDIKETGESSSFSMMLLLLSNVYQSFERCDSWAFLALQDVLLLFATSN